MYKYKIRYTYLLYLLVSQLSSFSFSISFTDRFYATIFSFYQCSALLVITKCFNFKQIKRMNCSENFPLFLFPKLREHCISIKRTSFENCYYLLNFININRLMDKLSVYIPIFIFLLYKIQKKRSHYLFNNRITFIHTII